jgi:menaquinone-specific isochorismate synthase
LSSLHPSPAVCGFPTEEAQLLIAETGAFIFDKMFFK